MKTKLSWLLPVLFLLCLSLLPTPASAQCKDHADHYCWNLQYILYAAQTDFREFRGIKSPAGHHLPKAPNPDVSVGAASVPCHTSIWSSAVSVYMCSADIPAAEVEPWYGKTMAELRQLQYLWQFKTEDSGTDHFVDAGPAGCEVAPLEKAYTDGSPADGPYLAAGPYFGDCPVHLETVQQADGKARVYFWVNSYSSPYIARRQDSPSRSLPQSARNQGPQSASASQPAGAQASSAAGAGAGGAASAETAGKAASEPAASKYASCDELCQGMKKIFEERTAAFRGLDAGSPAKQDASAASSDRTVKLSGAASCSINTAPSNEPRTSAKNSPMSRVHLAAVSEKTGTGNAAPAAPLRPAQYVCYWPEESAASAESQFRDLVAVVQMLMPSSWSVQQQNQPDELTGAEVTVWTARDARNKAAVGVYLNGKSVGLHVSASD
jgi:hypothetical protein